jgi:hypothetical protein
VGHNMNTLFSLRRLPWLPGTFLITLAAMVTLIVLATSTLNIVLGVGAMIVLSLGGGFVSYRRAMKRGFAHNGPARRATRKKPSSPYDTTEVMPIQRPSAPPPRWPRLAAAMRAAPLIGVGLAFCVNYRVAADLLSAHPASSLRQVIAVTLFALGFALGLAARPYSSEGSRSWLAWTALAVIITEWLTLFMLFTATFDGSYRSAIAPALLALGAVFPLVSVARELTSERYAAQAAGITYSGPASKPSHLRALWRSGGARLAVGALGLVALAAYMLLAAPTLSGPSLVARVWPIGLTILCVLIPRGKGEEETPEVTMV